MCPSGKLRPLGLMCLILFWAAMAGPVAAETPELRTLSLAGDWRCRLDPKGEGEKLGWGAKPLETTVTAHLPGSLAENGLGDSPSVSTKWTGGVQNSPFFTDPAYAPYRDPANFKVPFWLTPVKYYVGPAWYEREIEIPAEWADGKRRLSLFLERTHWETRLWVDGRLTGTGNSLATPHEFSLDPLKPGKHRLTLRVDNTVRINVGQDAHSVSDHTQSNWNGAVGRMELRADAPSVWIEDLQMFPDLAARSVKVRATVVASSPQPVEGVLTLSAQASWEKRTHAPAPKSVPLSVQASTPKTIEVDCPMGDDFLPWDEFTPAVYTMTAQIKTQETGSVVSETSRRFGMCQIATEARQITINGQKRFLRGTLECCIFPLTGYPPTDKASWARIMKTLKAHGLNELRFHSWCPPEAAFDAADEAGVYFQIECDSWTTVGDGKPIDSFVYAEGDRILKEYGNHPSFCFLLYGNEPSGKNQNRYLGDLVNSWKKKDARRLYSSASGWPSIPENQFHVTPTPRIQAWGDGLKSRVNARAPETTTDYTDFISQYDVPVVSHEIGQWCVYPNFDEIGKYKGVLQARNFEIFRDSLKANHMLDQAHDFLIASGKLQTLLYKEDIESALRTPGFGGFELLDLHDFPGQGTALVGVLDPFWDSKGYVTPEEYHRFACETVPLARMEKRYWTTAETFKAEIQVAHFGPAPLKDTAIQWTLADASGKEIAKGETEKKDLPLGNGRLGLTLSTPLSAVAAPAQCVLTLAIAGTPYTNSWDLWVYPPQVETKAPEGVIVADELTPEVLQKLEAGGKVLLLPAPFTVKGDKFGPVPAGFSSIFWNTAWTNRQPPVTLGILCDPRHPALTDFPTEAHSNWQWWDLIHGSQILILNDLSPELRPVVQVIDDWVTNRRLALVFEAQVGQGRLVVCGADLQNDLDNRPVARQMRASLLRYMSSDRFKPAVSVGADALKSLFQKPSIRGKVVSVDSEIPGYEGQNALDNNPATCWHTQWQGDNIPQFPHEIQIRLDKPAEIQGFTVVPRTDMQNGDFAQYAFYVSADGKEWGTPAAEGTFTQFYQPRTVELNKPVQGQFVRLVALTGANQQNYVAIAELMLQTGK